MIQRSTDSIKVLWKTIHSQKKRSKGTCMSSHFVTIYDMFIDKGSLYIIMEALEGDGIDFMTKFRGDVPEGNVPSLSYMNTISTMWRGLSIGIIEGLFNNDLFFSDIKPANVAYNQDKDGMFMFKWIDVECISTLTTGCYQIDYIDPYYIDFELQTESQNAGDKRFYTDLWKIGLSVLTMIIGYNPVSRLLDEVCGSCSDVSMYIYMKEHISDFKKIVEDERTRVLGLPDIPMPLQSILRYLLHPIGNKRFDYMKRK
jgi:serine/threonine protein kinase